MRKVTCLFLLIPFALFAQVEKEYNMYEISGTDSGYCVFPFKTIRPVSMSFDFTDLAGDTTCLYIYSADKDGSTYYPTPIGLYLQETGDYADSLVLDKTTYYTVFNDDTVSVIRFVRDNWPEDAFCFKVASQDSGVLILRISK